MSDNDQSGTSTSAPATNADQIAKTLIVLACIAFAIIICVSPVIGAYNSLVDSDIQVTRAASNIKTDLERRADLLPNLASTVKGSAVFEHNTLVEVTMARAGIASDIKTKISGTSDIDTLNMQDAQLTELYGNFVKLQEQYPTLETTQQFREFSAQVTATENQILVDRQTYNAAVMQYQSVCRSFPTVIFANYFGYSPDKYHMYVPVNETYAETVPAVTFNDMNL